MAKQIVTGEEYYELDGQLAEIKRQLRQPSGYPYRAQDLRTALQDIIEGRLPLIGDGSRFPTWRTIKLGLHKDAQAYREALEQAGRKSKISDWAGDIIGKPAFTVSTEEIDFELVRATVKEITGKDRATTDEVFTSAERLDLFKCPAEVGLALRLQYKEQPKGEWVRIAMEPITDSDGDLNVFSVEHDDDGLWLYANYGSPAYVWYGGDTFVFARRKLS